MYGGENDQRLPPSAEGRTRRTVLFSGFFIMLVVALVNHRPAAYNHAKLSNTLPQTSSLHGDLAAVHEAAMSKKRFVSFAQKGSLAQDSSLQKIKVRLYMESKCPACKKFTGYYVSKLLEAEGVSAQLMLANSSC